MSERSQVLKLTLSVSRGPRAGLEQLKTIENKKKNNPSQGQISNGKQASGKEKD